MQVMEIIRTGDLQRLKYEDTEETRAIKLFEGIYDVGACTVPSLAVLTHRGAVIHPSL